MSSCFLIFPGFCYTQAEEVEALSRRPGSLVRVVAMGELVGYNRSVVTIYRNGPTKVTPKQVAVERFPRIATLQVVNRLSRRTFRGVAPQNYTGFGK